MAFLQITRRELQLKIAYCGAVGAGRATSLRSLHTTLRATKKTQIFNQDHLVSFLLVEDPIRMVRSFPVELFLCTANSLRPLLREARGIVFVVDSSASRMDANLEALDQLLEELSLSGTSRRETPMALQYNKRDAQDALSLEELEQCFAQESSGRFASIATENVGVEAPLGWLMQQITEGLTKT